MKFKKGDRVRVVQTSGYIGEVGTITKINEDAYFPYIVKLDRHNNKPAAQALALRTPFQARELEKVD